MRTMIWLLVLTMVAPLQAADLEKPAREALQRMLPDSTLESVTDSPVPGLLEVVVGGEVLYLTRDGEHLLQGNVLRTRDGRNLTEGSRETLRAARIAAAPKEILISFEAEQPGHRITVFTALDCGYCRRFHGEIENYLAQGISVDYVLIPLGGEGSKADATSSSIHCAADRRTALDKAMRGEEISQAMCPSPYAGGKDLARSLGITSTPTFVASGGQKLRYQQATDMKRNLDELIAAR